MTLEHTRIMDKDIGWGTITFVADDYVIVAWDFDPYCFEKMKMDLLNMYLNERMDTMYTEEMIMDALEANNYKPTEFELADGTTAIVNPCTMKIDGKVICEYFLVDHPEFPWLSSDSAAKVAKTFNNILNIRKDIEDDKNRIREYFDKHQATGWDDDSWGFYSDWHKDLYGYRPHGYVCGEYIDTWAS